MPNKESFSSSREYIEYYRKYRKKNAEKFRRYNREYNKKWRIRKGFENQDEKEQKRLLKNHAHALVNMAVKLGILKRQICEVKSCGMDAIAHHDDYFKPLEVRWLCEMHHIPQHRAKVLLEKKLKAKNVYCQKCETVVST